MRLVYSLDWRQVGERLISLDFRDGSEYYNYTLVNNIGGSARNCTKKLILLLPEFKAEQIQNPDFADILTQALSYNLNSTLFNESMLLRYSPDSQISHAISRTQAKNAQSLKELFNVLRHQNIDVPNFLRSLSPHTGYLLTENNLLGVNCDKYLLCATPEELDVLSVNLKAHMTTRGRYKVLPKKSVIVDSLMTNSSIADLSSSSIKAEEAANSAVSEELNRSATPKTSRTIGKIVKGGRKGLQIQGLNLNKDREKGNTLLELYFVIF